MQEGRGTHFDGMARINRLELTIRPCAIVIGLCALAGQARNFHDASVQNSELHLQCFVWGHVDF